MSKEPTPAKPPTGNAGYTETLKAPSSGRVSSGFGPRKAPVPGASTNHKGIDYAVPTGTPVHAAGGGVVTYAGVRGGYGNTIEVTHDNGTMTRYAHLSSFDVPKGAAVVSGQVIAKSGATGRVSGAHLHYEVLKKTPSGEWQQVNPKAHTAVSVNTGERSDPKVFTAAATAEIDTQNKLAVLNVNQDAILQKLISGKHFIDNPANDYDNLTYHWRLFATTDSEVLSASGTSTSGSSETLGDLNSFYEKLHSFEQITIAESGVTTYSIDEVIMNSVVGTDFQVGSSKFTNIEVKVTEPNGVNFLDSLRNAALELGIRNYQKSFYYLELTFKGYETDGTVNLKPFDDLPNGGHWVWIVSIKDISVNLSAGGGSYVITLTPLTDTMLTGTYNLVPSNLHPSGATVGAFMDDFCTRLNNVWDRLKGGPGIVTYRAKFHPVADLLTADEVRAMSIVPKEANLSPVQGFDFLSAGNPSAQILQGFSVSDVLDSLMTACEQAQKLACDELIGDNSAYRQSILWRVEPEVHLPNFDPLYNEYYHHITLHIYGFRHHAAVLMPQDEKITNEAMQKNILTDLARRDFLPKKYEYLFTGVNSEVIDLDLSFNMAFQAVLPSLSSNTQEQAQTQAMAQAPSSAPAALRPDDQTQQRRQETVSVQKAAVDHESVAKDAINMSAQLDAARAETPQDAAKIADLEKKTAAAVKVMDASRVATSRVRSEALAARPANTPQTNYGRKFGEDLTQQASSYNLTKVRENEAFPITVAVYNPNVSDTVSLPGQAHNGKSMYGAVLNQVYGPMATQFFNISMTVKGDPFWIGSGSFEEAIYRQSDTFNPKQPNYPAGVNCFMFRMRYPMGQDETGQIIIKNNETVTGIYQVNSVQHKFVDGKFTQVLSALRIPLLDLGKSLFQQNNPTPPSEGTTPEGGAS